MTSSHNYRTEDKTIKGRVVELGTTIRENQFEYLLILPTLVVIFLLLWLPFFRGLSMSFYDWPLLGEAEWVGLGHYTDLVEWSVFWTSVQATLLYSLNTIIHLVLGIVGALIVYHLTGSIKKITSGLFLVSYALPPVVAGTLWIYLLDPNFGPIMHLFVDLGVLSEPVYWQANGDAALAVITLVGGWTFWPFVFLIVLAAREGIPENQYEIARLYGASRFQQLVKITLPQLKSAIIVAISLRLIWNLSKISQPFQMTDGGPGYDTSILGILLYRESYYGGQMGRAYAVGMVLLLISLGAIALFMWEFERQSGEVDF